MMSFKNASNGNLKIEEMKSMVINYAIYCHYKRVLLTDHIHATRTTLYFGADSF